MVSAEAHLGGTPFERYYSESAPDPERLIFQLVGNGDIRTAQDLSESVQGGIGALMIGRAAVVSPWLFAQLRGSAAACIDLLDVAQRFHRLLQQWQPTEFLHSRVRRFHHYCLTSLPFGGRLAAQVQGLANFDAVVQHVEGYFERFPRYRYIKLLQYRESGPASAE